ncbi:MAG: FHA domain-containing protein [Planctomycetota bacterium]|jgi:pSer/pThr/pTyr-binding forkhead associated (FHA) protein
MPSLLTVTGESIALRPNRCYVLGRAADCDIVVEDTASSRRHARLSVGGGSQNVFLEDLDSRNGTYVNEERISGRTRLESGSAIRIGATVYLLGLGDEPREDDRAMLDTSTKALEWLSLGDEVGEEILRVVKSKRSSTAQFSGQLGSFSLIEVLQIMNQAHKSGTLHVSLETGHAEVEIRDGEIYSASYQEAEGFPALVMLANQKTGIFVLAEKSTPCPKTIHEPAARLLLELCRSVGEKAPT